MSRNYKKEISYCITCMGRLNQLQHTLLANLNDCFMYNKEIEFVLVVFLKGEGDKEGQEIIEWVRNVIDKKYLEYGYFRCYSTTKLEYWHNCIAKNTAHMVGSGIFLINLDCDNFVTPQEVNYILNSKKNYMQIKCSVCSKRHQFFCRIKRNCSCNRNCKRCQIRKIIINKKCPSYFFIYHGFSQGYIHDGTYGEIGMPKSLFIQIGGYDQSFKPMGGGDLDLLRRLKLYAKTVTLRYTKRTAIINKKSEGLVNTKGFKLVRYTDNSAHKLWKKYNDYNMKISKTRIRQGKYCIRQNIGVKVTEVILN